MPLPQEFQGVVFDLFGTLIENLRRPDFEDMLAEMAAVLSVPEDGFRTAWNESWDSRSIGVFPTLEADLQNICRILNARPSDSHVKRAAEMGRGYARSLLLKPRPGALQSLNSLREAGYKTGLISNCATTIPPVWPDSPMAALIDAPVFSCSVQLKKPDPRIYRLACERLELFPKLCVYVADGNEGELTGAARAGLHPVLFSGPDADPYDEGRDRREWQGPTIQELGDVQRLLDQKQSATQ